MWAILGFLGNNIKWVVIGICAVIIALGAWKYTSLVKNYAIAQQTISQLKVTLEEKEKALKLERDLNVIEESVIAKQQEEITILQDDLDSITSDLSIDKDDLAPASIRETLKRLQSLK